MPDTPETKSPLLVAPDLPVRVCRREERYTDPFTNKPVVKVVEHVEFDATAPNWKGESVTMKNQMLADVPVGAVLKRCVEMYDELRKRYAEVAAERDALKAEAKRKEK